MQDHPQTKISIAVITTVSLAALIGLAWFDYITGVDIHSLLFYVLPVVGVAWVLPRIWTVVFAVLSMGAWLQVELTLVPHIQAHTVAFGAVSSFAVFLAVGLSISSIREQRDLLRQERNRQQVLLHELETKKKELEEANGDLDAFSRTVAHDLTTPLVSIQGYSDLLLTTGLAESHTDARDALDRIAKKSRIMADQIRGILNHARAGRQVVERKSINLTDLALEIASDLARTKDRKSVV